MCLVYITSKFHASNICKANTDFLKSLFWLNNYSVNLSFGDMPAKS